MSTKINARSPHYLSYTEPALPTVALTCTLVNLQGMEVDQFGAIKLPTTDFGSLKTYTSTASDFANGKFATVSTPTSRTVNFSVAIPANYSNSGDEILTCSATATQPTYTCTGGITNNGSIPNQSLNTGGATVDITLTNYFTGSIQGFFVSNLHTDFVATSITGTVLSLFSQSRAGVKTILVTAFDGNDLTCDATQTIQVTTTSTEAFACSDAFLTGGAISQSGTITDPTLEGVISARKSTSGGSTITSYPANTTGSARDVTLFFDITVPTGFSNTGATVECSKLFSQPSTTLPPFGCNDAGLTGQGIAVNGSIKKGTANKGTITAFSPISFAAVSSNTDRDVTFSITPPSSGYSNSGGSDISCAITMQQPAPEIPTQGNVLWYGALNGAYNFMTNEQFTAAGFDMNNLPVYNRRRRVLQYDLDLDQNNLGVSAASTRLQLTSTSILSNINTAVYYENSYGSSLYNLLNQSNWNYKRADTPNPTNGAYLRITQSFENNYGFVRDARLTYWDSLSKSYWIKVELTGFISEIWSVNSISRTFSRLA